MKSNSWGYQVYYCKWSRNLWYGKNREIHFGDFRTLTVEVTKKLKKIVRFEIYYAGCVVLPDDPANGFCAHFRMYKGTVDIMMRTPDGDSLNNILCVKQSLISFPQDVDLHFPFLFSYSTHTGIQMQYQFKSIRKPRSNLSKPTETDTIFPIINKNKIIPSKPKTTVLIYHIEFCVVMRKKIHLKNSLLAPYYQHKIALVHCKINHTLICLCVFLLLNKSMNSAKFSWDLKLISERI